MTLVTANALESKNDFLFEKRSKMYYAVLRTSIAKEKSFLGQKPFWCGAAIAPAEKGGALL